MSEDDLYVSEAPMSELLRLDRPWSEYPLGTKAHAITGGYWIKVPLGWKWHNGSTFPTPGGDACGCCVELPMSESQTPRVDRAEGMMIELSSGVSGMAVFSTVARELESELTATRARLAELEGIAERLYRQIGSKDDDDTVPVMLAYEAYKEGKK